MLWMDGKGGIKTRSIIIATKPFSHLYIPIN